jgi:hypothetical protein
VLATIVDPMDEEINGGDDYNEKGCAFCGGLGHRVATCPKLEQARMNQTLTPTPNPNPNPKPTPSPSHNPGHDPSPSHNPTPTPNPNPNQARMKQIMGAGKADDLAGGANRDFGGAGTDW